MPLMLPQQSVCVCVCVVVVVVVVGGVCHRRVSRHGIKSSEFKQRFDAFEAFIKTSGNGDVMTWYVCDVVRLLLLIANAQVAR
jgi:hypothetical protein